jgi:hypothetical protein
MTYQDDDDDKPPPIPLGDYLTMGIALVFLGGFLYLIFGPSPFEGMFKKTAPPPSGEVTVTIPQKAK